MGKIENTTKVIEEATKLLAATNPLISTGMAAVVVLAEIFRRKKEGEPELTLAQMATMTVGIGTDIKGRAQTWLDENPEAVEEDADGGEEDEA